MRLTRLQLRNYRSHRALDLNLRPLTQAVLVGDNGAGKSSLLSGMSYALYGATGVDDLIAYGEETMGVDLSFDRDGAEWTVKRGRQRGKKSWLVVTRDGTPLTKGSINDTQAFLIRDVLGMDSDGFRASVYVPQGESGAFAAMGAGDRKGLLLGLLGLDAYEGWRQKAAEDARSVEGELNGHRSALETLEYRKAEAEQAAARLPALGREMDGVRRELASLDERLDVAIEQERARASQALRKQLQAEMRDLVSRAEASKAQAQMIRKLRAELHELDTDNLTKLIKEFDDVRTEYDQHRHRAARNQTVVERRDRARAQATEARDKIKHLDEHDAASCPTCDQTLDQEKRALVRERFVVDMVAHEQNALESEQEIVELPEPPVYDEEAHVAAINKLQRATTVKGMLDGAATPESLDALRQAFRKAKKQLEAIPEVRLSGETANAIRTAQSEVRDTLEALRDEYVRQKSIADTGAEIKIGANQLADSISSATEEREALLLLAQAFSHQGIPAMMLESALDGITDAANEMLQELGADYRVRLTTQRAKKSGDGMKETLDALIESGGVEYPLENFSGGEQYRINIALRVGLASMMAGRAGGRCDFLLVDEPTDLDKNGLAALASVLTHIDKQVLLVTHHDELKDQFAQVVAISRASAASPSTVEIR